MNKLTVDPCLEHTGHIYRIEAREKDDGDQWKAIDGLREDVKGLLWKIGSLVGGISVINTIVIAIVVHFITKGHP